MAPAFSIREHDTIYDYCWHPAMNSSTPQTCLFASTSKNTPIHMWSAFTGALTASYVPWKDPDCLEAALSLTFNNDGTKLYAGFAKSIKIFDVERPGDTYVSFDTVIKRKRKEPLADYTPGLPGLVSCLTFDPARATGLFAASTYNGNIGLFDEANDVLVDILPYPKGAPLRGVTQTMFSRDGYLVFAGYRKSSAIIGWDIRNTTAQEIHYFERSLDSNQRIQFDLDPSGKYLVTGGQDGTLSTFSLATSSLISSQHLSNTCLNAATFHPYLPLLATSFGQRHFILADEDGTQTPPPVVTQPLSIWGRKVQH
eukprot:gene1470-1707_t